jgi:iron complex transport system ATP-binding protein
MNNLLDVSDLTLAVQDRILYQGINFSVAPTECWVILGSNGAGKTTLLHHLAGFHPISFKNLMVLQKNIATYPRKILAQTIGVLLQQELTAEVESVQSALKLARYPYDEEPQLNIEIIKQMIQDFALQDLLHKPLHALSGGEKQRVMVAQVFAQQPNLFLLDEPTNHLAPNYQLLILQLLQKQLAQNNAAIMVLQDINLAYRFATHVILLLEQGRFLIGKARDLLQKHYLEELYQLPLIELQHQSQKVWIPA